MESHRAYVEAKLADLEENLKLIDYKIDVYRACLAPGDADELWPPAEPASPGKARLAPHDRLERWRAWWRQNGLVTIARLRQHQPRAVAALAGLAGGY